MSFITRWWSGNSDEGAKRPSPHSGGDVLGANDASSDEILQALQLKRIQQLRESQAMETNNRTSAAMFLQQKSIIDTRIKQMDGQIHNMQSQSAAMETAAMSAQMTRTLRREADSMRQIVDTVSLEDVEELTDDLHDLSTQSYEMGDALARPIGAPFMPIGVEDTIEDQLNAWSVDAQRQQTTMSDPVPIKEPPKVQIKPPREPTVEHPEDIYMPSVPVRNDVKLKNQI
jgi:2C-methyl-D-erythritol 2,4-cyclodiphosphate synthase